MWNELQLEQFSSNAQRLPRGSTTSDDVLVVRYCGRIEGDRIVVADRPMAQIRDSGRFPMELMLDPQL